MSKLSHLLTELLAEQRAIRALLESRQPKPSGRPRNARLRELTPRQREVYDAVADHHGNLSATAAALQCSVPTVREAFEAASAKMKAAGLDVPDYSRKGPLPSRATAIPLSSRGQVEVIDKRRADMIRSCDSCGRDTRNQSGYCRRCA